MRCFLFWRKPGRSALSKSVEVQRSGGLRIKLTHDSQNSSELYPARIRLRHGDFVCISLKMLDQTPKPLFSIISIGFAPSRSGISTSQYQHDFARMARIIRLLPPLPSGFANQVGRSQIVVCRSGGTLRRSILTIRFLHTNHSARCRFDNRAFQPRRVFNFNSSSNRLFPFDALRTLRRRKSWCG